MFRVAYAIGVLPRAEQVDFHLGFLSNAIDNVFLWGAGRVLRSGTRIPNHEGFWARSARVESENKR